MFIFKDYLKDNQADERETRAVNNQQLTKKI